MMDYSFFTDKKAPGSIPLIPINAEHYDALYEKLTKPQKTYLSTVDYKPKTGEIAVICNQNGEIEKVFVGVANDDIWSLAGLYNNIPEKNYHLQDEFNLIDASLAYIGFGLGAYKFDKYKKKAVKKTKLFLPEEYLSAINKLKSIFIVRDLINTPTEDMRPQDLSKFAKEITHSLGGQFREIVGEDLLKENYPTIHAVGRASNNAPRLIDIYWGDENHPKVTLVGKGVCFDTGGLDIKPPSGMLIMHKDMGGSAHVLGLAHLIMAQKLPVRLRVLIPAVENSISSNAYRPSDIITTRSGKTVQVLNTDAEGRLVLCDALTEAVSEKPDLLIDMATLTGASRVALGAEVPSVFSNNDVDANKLIESSQLLQDPLWRMPLYQPYMQYLDNSFADLGNVALSYPYGGAIIAALFLQEFVGKDINWIHFDVGAWNFSDRPGRPKGGECMGLRAIYKFIEEKYS